VMQTTHEVLASPSSSLSSSSSLSASFESSSQPLCPSSPRPSSLTIKGSLTSIPDECFQGWIHLKHLTVSSFVNSIGARAFAGCVSLQSVTLTEQVSSIGEAAFKGCESLTAFRVPRNVTSIAKSTFSGCTALLWVNLPDAVTKLEDGSFSDCKSLLVVNMSAGLSGDEDLSGAFRGCFALERCLKLWNDAHRMEWQKNLTWGEFLCKGRFSMLMRFLDPVDEILQPLHSACTAPQMTVEQLKKAVAAIPHGVRKRGRQHNTTRGYSTYDPDIECSMFSQGAERFTNLTPLHLACVNPTTSLKVLEYLVEWDGSALAEKDAEDKVPLQCALNAHQPAPILRYLFACHPIALNSCLGPVALDYLEHLRENPPTSVMTFSPGEQNGWVEFISSSDVLDLAPDKAIVDRDNMGWCERATLSATAAGRGIDLITIAVNLIRACSRDTAEVLCYSKDLTGRLAIEVAVPPIKAALRDKLFFIGRYQFVSATPIHKSATCVVLKAVDYKAKEDYQRDFQKYVQKYNVGKTSICRTDFKKVILDMGLRYDGDLFDEKFDEQWDVDNGNSISEDEFINFAVSELDHGEPRKVVLKLMKYKDQFKRELESRENYDLDSKHVVAALHTHGGKEDREEEKSRFYTDLENEGFGEYKFALVMPFADSNLDTIFRSQRPGPLVVRDLFVQIAEGVRHLHTQGVLHADLKVRCAVAVFLYVEFANLVLCLHPPP
jgi:hypothetical protein